ncbi:MAG: hypothetical protein NWE94_06635 [Candidatus Bathyarchaeota archaeon]|nr:hypothetical protein [Candidatus Bathyarchaeota archaeon]
MSVQKKPRQFYVGVTYCGNSTAEAKLLIDRVKTYTNLFVLQSFNISRNETATKEICDYAVAQGLNLIVNLGIHNESTFAWQQPLLETAKQRWGDKFLGVYYDDEPGGIQLDCNWNEWFESAYFARYRQFLVNSTLIKIYYDLLKANASDFRPDSYEKEAFWFTGALSRWNGPARWKAAGFTLFISDYALYWWDYLAGYDVLLAQFGWNHTITQDIALVRGAARLQNKTWGAIMTWTYTEEPYLANGTEIYNQLLMAYEAGATYAVIFNHPKIGDNPYGVLMDEHFEALERFWNDVMVKPNIQIQDFSQAEAALILPKDYGWGIRRPDDRIWGFWGPDEKSPQIWDISRRLLEQYGLNLDIVYDDPGFPAVGKYPKIYYWNQTT